METWKKKATEKQGNLRKLQQQVQNMKKANETKETANISLRAAKRDFEREKRELTNTVNKLKKELKASNIKEEKANTQSKEALDQCAVFKSEVDSLRAARDAALAQSQTLQQTSI